MTTRGFSLLEVLAAAVVVGLVAAVVVPWTMRLHRRSGGAEERVAARAWLDQHMATITARPLPVNEPIDGHLGWWVQAFAVDADGPLAAGSPPRRYALVVVATGADPTARRVAEHLHLLPEPGLP